MRKALFSCFALFVLQLLLWVPFGLENGCYAEGCVIASAVDQNPSEVFYPNRVRFAEFIPYHLAYRLTPDHFTGINIMILVVMTLRGWVALRLAYLMGIDKHPLAFAVAALVAVFPADQAYFYHGALLALTASLCYLFALMLFLDFLRIRGLWRLLLMAAALFLDLAIYDSTHIVAVATPILILIIQRGRNLAGFFSAAFVWYFTLSFKALQVLRLMNEMPAALAYQQGLISPDNRPETLISALLGRYSYHFYGTWLPDLTDAVPSYVFLAILASLLAFFAFRWLQHDEVYWGGYRGQGRVLGLTVLGLLFVGLSLAIYLPTVLRDSAERTLFLSGAGAALALAMGIWFVLRLFFIPRAIYFLVISLLVGLAVYQQLNARSVYIDLYRQQADIAAQMVRLAPGPSPETLFLLIDESTDSELRGKYTLSSLYPERMLQMVYRDYSLRFRLCYPNQWQPWGYDREVCRLDVDSVVLAHQRTYDVFPTQIEVMYSHILVFTYDDTGEVELVSRLDAVSEYDPLGRMDPAATLPRRYKTFLNP